MTTINNRALDWVSAQTQPVVLGLLCLVGLGAFLVAFWPKFQMLRRAASEDRLDRPFQRLWHTMRVAFLQSRMFKHRDAGWMHALIFWGFLVLLLRAVHFFAIGFFPGMTIDFPGFGTLDNLYTAIKDVFVLLVTLAVMYALYRRLVIRPKRLTLSGEGILILVLILAIMVSDVIFEAAWWAKYPDLDTGWGFLGAGFRGVLGALEPVTVAGLHNVAYWTHIVSILFFITLLPRSKHFHIITSIPNVFFSHVEGRGNQLHRIDFEDEEQESFGITRIEDFSWKKMLDLHTCTECGRCDVFCPALNSNKPLSPKQLTVDLRDHLNRQTASSAEGEDGKGGGRVLLGEVIQDETLWSCTTCGACEEECPVMIEYVNKVIDLRRGLVLTEDRYPQEFAAAFRSLETNSNPWGFAGNSRADWAQGLDVPLWDKSRPTEYLYFVGCNGSYDDRGKKISRSVVAALKQAKVDFSILGNDEGCTGDPARRAGNEYLFDMLATRNAETFKERQVRKIITHCPHCFNALKNEYAEFGLDLEVIHHSELLDRLMREGRIKSDRPNSGTVVYHDSCYMGRHNKVYDEPRRVIAGNTAPGSVREVENSRERGTCCGAGGGRFLLEETTGTRMSHNRVDELMQANPDTIAVSCPFCVLMLEDAVKARNLQDKVRVRDISELGNGDQ